MERAACEYLETDGEVSVGSEAEEANDSRSYALGLEKKANTNSYLIPNQELRKKQPKTLDKPWSVSKQCLRNRAMERAACEYSETDGKVSIASEANEAEEVNVSFNDVKQTNSNSSPVPTQQLRKVQPKNLDMPLSVSKSEDEVYVSLSKAGMDSDLLEGRHCASSPETARTTRVDQSETRISWSKSQDNQEGQHTQMSKYCSNLCATSNDDTVNTSNQTFNQVAYPVYNAYYPLRPPSKWKSKEILLTIPMDPSALTNFLTSSHLGPMITRIPTSGSLNYTPMSTAIISSPSQSLSFGSLQGLQLGDVLIRLNGNDVSCLEGEIVEGILRWMVNRSVRVTYLRKNVEI